MDKNQLDETFGGIVDNKFDTVIGKIVEKDGKYVFEGVSLSKAGQVIGTVTYVAGVAGLFVVGIKIGEKIADKIHQRRVMKAKAEALDDVMILIEQTRKEMEEELSKGKHSKNEESE